MWQYFDFPNASEAALIHVLPQHNKIQQAMACAHSIVKLLVFNRLCYNL